VIVIVTSCPFAITDAPLKVIPVTFVAVTPDDELYTVNGFPLDPDVPLDPEEPLVPDDPFDPDVPLDPELPEDPEEPELPDEPEEPFAPLYTHEIVYVTVFSVPLPRIHVKEKSK
jgi:hypothetical protein